MKLGFYGLLIGALFLTGCSTHYSDRLYRQRPGFYAYILGNVENKHIDTEHYADVYATPASCQKIITALLAYKTLGADYRYQTRLYATKKDGAIQDVVVRFSGDPTLSTEHLMELLKPLKNKTIHGTFLLDASLFKTPAYSTNIMAHDVGSKYAQPVSSINIDTNLINVDITAKKTLGKAAHLHNDAGYIDSYILHKMHTVMKRLKIKAKLRIVYHLEKMPTHARLVKTNYSDTLGTIIPPALKKSDNLIFDSLYLTMVHAHSPKPIEDWSEGDPIIKELIYQNFGMDMSKALLVDGSGLSRYNRIQPRQLFEILRQGYANQAFVDALPHPGEVDTTLEKRTLLPPNLKAKTGGLLGISCLCGYGTKGGKPKAFVMMVNSFEPPTQESIRLTDSWVARHLGP